MGSRAQSSASLPPLQNLHKFRAGLSYTHGGCSRLNFPLENNFMKTVTTLTAMFLGLAVSSFAADFKGFVQDEACSTKPAMKDNAECSKKCIDGGAKAVLVTPDGNRAVVAG